MSSSLAAMSESRLNAKMAFAGKWYGVRCAAELCSEDPNRFAGQIVDPEFRRVRDLG
ncbi:hypothetical protein [Streptomyces griseorubiginosus]|uniref:hypothetical protein n=1 Tax=Streptomyces griseorubiginosus TaxID=67304 RepID=UPI003323E79D